MRLGRTYRPSFLVGIASIPAQAILLRELLARGAGSELSLTFDLAIWLAGSAAGARFWGMWRERNRPLMGPLLAAGILVAAAALAAARLAPFPGVVPGEVPGPVALLALGFLVLFLTSFLTAGLFPLAAARGADRGKAYIAEALGALVGGLLTTLLFVSRIAPLTVLILLLAIVLTGSLRRPFGWIAGGALLVVGLLGGTDRLDDALFRFAWERRHPGLRLLGHAATPTRVLTLSEREGERWYLADDAPAEVLDDPYRDERIAAFLLAAAPRVGSVLLIDFGAAGVAPVLARAGVARVACLIPEREDTLFVPPAPGVSSTIGDPRRSLRSLRETFDLIALSGGEAVSVASNRLWTTEAFAAMAARLSPTGVVVAIAPGGEAAAGSEAWGWRSSVAAAMEEGIGPTSAIDADDFVLVASKVPGTASLDPDSLIHRFVRGGVRGGWTLSRYPPQRFSIEYPRSRQRALAPAPSNRDLRPAAFAYALSRWVRRAGIPPRSLDLLMAVVGGVLVVLLLGPRLVRRRARKDGTAVLIATGAAAMGLDLLVLMTYQARVGVLQSGMGALLGAFLGGTALGAALSSRRNPESERRDLVLACLIQAGVAAAATYLLPRLPSGPTLVATILYGAAAFALGATCGFPFPIVARTSSVAHAWAADAVGGIFGAILVLAFVGRGFTGTGLALAVLPVLVATTLLGRGAPRSPSTARSAQSSPNT